MLPEHHHLLNELAALSASAEPSAFHSFLSKLDTEGRLLRCYTQNIDGLEARAGLEVGIPARRTRRSPKKSSSTSDYPESGPPTPGASPGQRATPSPGAQPAPRCIPLHGQLTHLYCPLCPTVVPLADHLPLPSHAIPCPTCHLSSSIRHALSERQRKVGSLRASVVLYGEEHPQGELIGSVMERDLRGLGRKGEKEGKVDLLLVVGTSLAIPGVKRIVKEMARSLAGPSRSATSPSHSSTTSRTSFSGPKTILVNREMPKGTEWEGVFDTFISGDIQDFTTEYLTNPSYTAESPKTPKKRKAGIPPTPETTPSRRQSTKSAPARSSNTPMSTPTKKRRRVESATGESRLPATPRPTPPRPRIDSSNFDRPCKTHDLDGDAGNRSETPLTPVSELEEENPFLVAR